MFDVAATEAGQRRSLPIAGKARRPCLSTRRLKLIILPTERCNYRCVYCFEDFALPRMARPTVRGIKALLAARAPDLDQLSIDWFGGEPLLAAAIVEDVQGFAQLLARRHDIEFAAMITTNGHLLDRRRFRRLVELGIHRYEISLDGPQPLHDRKRVEADGRGTFDRIWRNLEALRATDLEAEIVLRIHVDRDNCEALPAFLDDLASAFGSDGRFRVFLRPLSRLGGPNDEGLPILEGAERNVIADLRRKAAQLGFGLHGESVAPICYAAAANAFVIRSNGEVGKCSVALTDPANRVGRLYEDGRLELDHQKVMPWIQGLFTGEPSALACPLDHMRAGTPVGAT